MMLIAKSKIEYVNRYTDIATMNDHGFSLYYFKYSDVEKK